MDQDKASILDILAMMGLIVFFTFMTASVVRTDSFGTLFLGAITLFLLWILMKDLRKGVRPPTRWEWFKAWMIVRPVLIGAVGFAFFMGLLSIDRDSINAPNNVLGIVLTGIALLWGGLILYTIWRAPRRKRESDSDYKKRIGYTDPEN